MVKVIKLSRKDDLGSVIKQIKNSTDTEIIFDVGTGSPLIANSDSLKLMKKTAEILRKTVKIQTLDGTGQILAKKLGVLAGSEEVKISKPAARVARSDIKPSGKFSDIRTKPRVQVAPIMPRVQNTVPDIGSRVEFSLAKSSSKFSKFFILGLIILVVAVFGVTVLLPKADIKVYGRSEPISRDLEINVDKTILTPNPVSMQIPGINISKEVSQTKSFETTGTKSSGTKATGVVTIFNFTPNTLTLKAATTTLLVNGKKYLFTQDVTGIRGNGNATPNVAIVAETGGADYNISNKVRFQIVNTALGEANVYAENPNSITGGTTKDVIKVLSQEDLDKATNQLISEVVAVAASNLSEEMGEQIRLIDSGITKEVLAKTANKNVGDETESFDMTLIARITGIGFKQAHVNTVAEAKINEVLSEDKYLLDGQEQFTANFKSLDLLNSKGVISVHFQTVAAYKVDASNLSKILAGKNESEIKEILLSKPEIDNVEVKFWPDWFVHKAPRFNGKINIETILEQ